MPVQVVGVIKTPMGTGVSKAKIRITPTTANVTTLPFVCGVITADSSGNYDFTLEDGSFLIEAYVPCKKSYGDAAVVTVNKAVSPGPFTIEGLIATFGDNVPIYPEIPSAPTM